MGSELDALNEFRDKPAGTIRISATDYASDTILLPKLAKLLCRYPDIKVEIVIGYGLTDIVAGRYDAGVRIGEQVANDLISHNCINLLLPTHGALYAWEFEKDDREFMVRVDGQLIFDGTTEMLNAALTGFGIAYVPDTCRNTWPSPISPRGASSGCWKTGACPFRAITFSTPAAANPPRPSLC